MRSNLRNAILTVAAALLAAPAPALAAAGKNPPSGRKAAETGPADTGPAQVRRSTRRLTEKKPEKKPQQAATFAATVDESELNAKTEAGIDVQIDQLKRIIPKVQGPQKADLLFQLAELWWQKSKIRAHMGFKKFTETYDQWVEKRNRGEEAGPEPRLESFTREAELYRQEALRKYEEILKEYPAYDRKDEVLFAFAYNKYEIGQKEEAIAKYNELIKQYPTSRFVPDAYVQMGEHFFATNQLSKARTAYEKALTTNVPKIKYFAIYKLAWCDFNAGAYAEAVEKFKEVIAHSRMEKGGTGLKSEALRDIVLSFVQLDVVDDAIVYFKKNAGKDSARTLIASLGNKLQEAGKHESAIKAFRTLINDEPNDARCPEYQNAIITSYEGLRRRDMVAKEMRRLVELYRPNSPWAKANAANKTAIDIAYEITENAMRTMVTEYHQEAQKTKAVETYRLARDIYKEYLDNFADSEFAYNLRFYYAEILWALQEYEKAAEQYALVVDRDPEGQYSKMASYDAILCYEKLVEIEKGNLKVQDFKEGQKIDEKRRKEEVKATKVKLDRREGAEEEIPKWEAKLVEAIDRYVTLYPGSDDEITVRYKAAFVFYDHRHDVEAARRFGEIIAKWPTDQWSRRAADLSLDILAKKEEWLELNKLAREFAANKKLIGNDRDFGNRVSDLVEASQYKYIDEVIYKAQKKPAEAAVMFREFVREFPKSKYAAQALLYAMIIHSEAAELDLGIEVGERLLREYPDGVTVNNEPTKGRTMLYLGSFYEKTADFEKAADYYERYVDLFLAPPEEPAESKAKKKPARRAAKEVKRPGASLGEEEGKVADALYNAALWNEGLGRFDKAIALYNRYVTVFPSRKDTPDIYLNIALIHEKQKNFRDAQRYFKGFVDLYAKDVPVGRVLFAKYREMLALRELKQEKDALAKAEDIIKFYERLPESDRLVDQAANAYAHARFLALEPMWRDYVGIKFDNVGRLRKDLKAKLEALPKVEKAYTGVLQTGSPEWGIAALTRIGQAYQDFARNLIESPDPRGLDEDQLAMYRGELENRAFPLEEKAIEAFEKALEKSTELFVYNDWTVLAQEQINRFKPGAFLERREVPYMGSDLFATAPAILTAPQPPPRPAPAAGSTPAQAVNAR